MNSYDFKNQVAVVTGGANGIGFSVAERLSKSGASVKIWDLDIEAAQTAAETINAEAVECDITDWISVQNATETSINGSEKIDILVNSAGIAGPNDTVVDYDNKAWDRIISVNLTGTYYVNKAVVPHMKANGYGRIVNIASVAGKDGNPNASAYSASKAGVIALTKSLGKELADSNIAVNCVTPAAARTAIFDQMSQEHIDYMLSKIPRGRFVEVKEISSMIAWMVSAENSFTTGAVFDLSGGRSTY
ncbi:MAG: SDR family NAD(P)-dependent oxidoreductase [Paracoccaceae bacterium]|nr:SDR family NAD(P)-dependent oxidoreductase [Paracoccaceae bacterium]NCW05768.1 SDR family oxidoreductase [Rhodobacterales bacterium]NDA28936.1 SDR family oxidoreductase [Alphaproteobacteria bacterium]NCX28728.1 SDR family oxidoreductase [Rhodobacterales bacterium]NCX57774.1 SDR family oxidoreductase [Paracoccaceae bacterium]